MTVAQYSQTDPKWGAKKLSPSPFSMAQFGCLVTSISNALANYAVYEDPGTVLDKLIAVGGFDQYGNLNHEAVPKAYPQLIFYERQYTTNCKKQNVSKVQAAVALERVKKLLKLGQPVHLHVDNLYNDKMEDHFVTAVDFEDSKLVIHNPDGGKKEVFDNRYGDPLTNLYGYYALIGPPINFPKDGWPGFGQSLWKLAKFRKDNGSALNKLIAPHYVSEAIDSFIS